MATTAPAPIDAVPSASYSFEPEFTGQPPRPIPDRLDEGPYARGQRTASGRSSWGRGTSRRASLPQVWNHAR